MAEESGETRGARVVRTLRAGVRDPDVLAGAAVSALLLAHVAYYFPRVVDDVFISLRYAENLAHGRGAIFNEGERVEGYSSPAWMFIQAFGILLGFEAVTFGKVVGVACLFAVAFGSRAIARRMFGVMGWHSWIPPFCVAANSYAVAWAVLGLETPFFLAALVLAPLAVHRLLEPPPDETPKTARRALVLGVLTIVGLGAARPEAPLYIILAFASPLVFVRSRAGLIDVVRRLWRLAAIAGGILAALLGLRLAYYRDLYPNTYYVKGAHSTFELAKLEDLYKHGTVPLEAAFYAGGVILLVWAAFQRKQAAPALFALANLYFTASVTVDWMPSLRHLLPVTILASIGWSWLAKEVQETQGKSYARTLTGLVTIAMLHVLRIDSRLSVLEHRDVWNKPKTMAKWSDTVLAYKRIEPPHVTSMDRYEMGMIAMAWAVLETSAEPVETSWWAGRDIGAVGYYTGVRVFDTEGLVTKEVARNPAWAQGKQVTDDLLKMMLAKRPLSADVFDGWDGALGRNSHLTTHYRVAYGNARSPNRIVATDRVPPAHEEIVRRYRAAAAKFPQLYHLHTLYGESVGAAVERRLRIVEAGR